MIVSNRVLTAGLEVVTPVFCAGADQKGPAEIRPLSLRGALRWWYRAVDRDFAKHEAEFFGGVGEKPKASPVAVQLGSWLTGTRDYKARLDARRAPGHGDAYLGYTLYLGGNERRCVPEGRRFNLRLRCLRDDTGARRAWAASLWLFGHLGGLGTRSRRGFGTLALNAWEGWPECEELRPAHTATTPQEWKRRFEQGFRKVREWFAPVEQGRHHHLGDRVPLLLWREGAGSCWEALDEAGKAFQGFRKKGDNHSPGLLAAFGLPLRFRSSRQPMRLRDFHRAPSRLQFRVVKIAGKYHPLIWCAQGPLAPEKIQLELDGRPVPYGGDKLIEKFLASVRDNCV